MRPNDSRRYSLQELAEASGLPARTIRYYISRGLLSGPVTAGRSAYYEERHLDRLREIRELQRQGQTLAAIATTSAGQRLASSIPEPAAVWQYELSREVTVWLRSDTPPWRRKRIQAALSEFARALREEPAGQDPQKG